MAGIMLRSAKGRSIMCGRAYETFTEEELAMRYLNRKASQIPKIPALSPNYNFCPTQNAPVVRQVDGERQVDLFHWQLIPPWEPEFKTRLSTINAKSETIFESRLYKGIVTKRRCIVPLSGFFEWKRDGEKKRPFAIHLKNEPIMSVAGIWSSWQHGDKPERHSFSILTTEANDFMKKIHDRMPVILAPKDEDAWLDPEIHEPAELMRLMKPCPSSWLASFEVSTMVNSPRNNRPEVLRPVAE